jgi:hypothetical protein
MKGLYCCLVLSSVAVGCSRSGLSGSGSATLTLNPKLNNPYTYQVESKVTGSPAGDQDIKMTEVYTFTDKTATGYNLSTKITDISGGSGLTASALSGLKGTETKMAIDARGSVTTAGTAAPGLAQSVATSMSGMGAGFDGLTLPTGPVQVGKTWTGTVDLAKANSQMASALAGGDSTITINYKVASISGSTVTIDSSFDKTFQMKAGGAGTMTLAMSQTSNYDVDSSDGLLKRADTKSKTAITGSSAMNINTEAITTRQ